jgi:hypothetical protein
MRTTLTLDKDVAAMLERARKTRGGSLKDVVNEALRAGLKQATTPPRRRTNFRTTSADLGACLLSNVDNVAEVLAIVEGEATK